MMEGYFMLPDWSLELRMYYWDLRMRRVWKEAKRRKLYRRIAKEKRRLEVEVGIERERIRLLCRCLVNPRNRYAEERYEAYCEKLERWYGYC